jgi:hypothetical protein
MMAAREHRVPLLQHAVAISRGLESGEFVFPGQARNKPISNMAMEMVLHRLKVGEARLRPQLSRLGRKRDQLPPRSDETALAHVIGDKAEQTYRMAPIDFQYALGDELHSDCRSFIQTSIS